MDLRKLDALVAEHVMGWIGRVKPHPELPIVSLVDLYMDSTIPMPRYSTDIAAAWEVVEKFVDIWIGRHFTYDLWVCRIRDEKADYEAKAGSVSLAICLAALKAKNVLSDFQLSDPEAYGRSPTEDILSSKK